MSIALGIATAGALLATLHALLVAGRRFEFISRSHDLENRTCQFAFLSTLYIYYLTSQLLSAAIFFLHHLPQTPLLSRSRRHHDVRFWL